jgi:phosphatidate cytidylyltransferase
VLAQRLLTAAVAIPLLIGLVSWAPRWLFVTVMLAMALLGQWELYRMFARVGVRAEQVAGLLLGGIVVLAFAAGAQPGWPVPLALSFAVAGCLALGLRRAAGPGVEWAGIALTLLGVCYCAWLLGHVIWLRALPEGAGLTYLVLAVTWCGETAAYFVGRRWGRRKLAPRISPAKTVEGGVAQVAVSVAAAVVTAWVVALRGLPPLHLVGVGLALGIVGQVGDLAESFLKRSADTKDASGLVPGHGGLLDRLDSLLFNVPALYYYVKIFSNPT